MLNSLKIGIIGLLIAFVLSLLLLVTLSGIRSFSEMTENLRVTAEDKLRPTRLSGRIQRNLDTTRIQLLLALQHDAKSEFSKLHDHPLSVHIDNLNKARGELERGVAGNSQPSWHRW